MATELSHQPHCRENRGDIKSQHIMEINIRPREITLGDVCFKNAG